MRYAVISDIHSNIDALEKVLKKIEDDNIDRILCLGDIVGYGANPNECVERVREN
ncbi:MAG: metallophosphoesterase family protein, partial [Candidatus Eremiobacterota bacterium]